MKVGTPFLLLVLLLIDFSLKFIIIPATKALLKSTFFVSKKYKLMYHYFIGAMAFSFLAGFYTDFIL